MPDDTAREDDHEDGAPVEDAPVVPSDEVAAALVAQFPGALFDDSHGQPVVYVDRSVWVDVAKYLRDEQQFTMCVDITATDHLLDGTRYRAPALVAAGVDLDRFEMVANYLSHSRNRRIRVICQLPVGTPTIASLTAVYPGTNFPERETFDLYGIEFEGHPELTRILMPDDWLGHPLRKDYAPARVPVTFKGDPHPR